MMMDELSAGEEMEVVTTDVDHHQLLPPSRTITVTNGAGSSMTPKSVASANGSLASQGVPVLQITIVHAGNSHTISKGNFFVFAFKSCYLDEYISSISLIQSFFNVCYQLPNIYHNKEFV